MADKKVKYHKLKSPRGIAAFPWLVFGRPDKNFAKTDTAPGNYRLSLICTLTDAEPLMAKLDAIADEAYAEAMENLTPIEKAKIAKGTFGVVRVCPYEMEMDKHTGEETGCVAFRFSTLAAYTDKKDGMVKQEKLNIFDAKGAKIPHENIDIGPGSVCIVALSSNSYIKAEGDRKKCGATKYLDGIQVVDLCVSGGGGAAYYGFGEEEGFTADQTMTMVKKGADDTVPPPLDDVDNPFSGLDDEE